MNSRLHPGRPANDNRDMTELMLMVFGPGLIVALVVSALLLVKVW